MEIQSRQNTVYFTPQNIYKIVVTGGADLNHGGGGLVVALSGRLLGRGELLARDLAQLHHLTLPVTEGADVT
jgi:hypothetical protein